MKRSHIVTFAAGVVCGVVGLIIQEEWALARERAAKQAFLDAAPPLYQPTKECIAQDCHNLAFYRFDGPEHPAYIPGDLDNAFFCAAHAGMSV